MSSVYQHVLGERFENLQPQLREYFSLSAGDARFGVGTGVFDVVGCPLPWLRPLLAPAASEHTFFPEYGTNIPFRISNHAHLDPFGRPSLTAQRTIHFPHRTRIFEDTTSLESHGPKFSAVDYVGRRHRLVTDLDMQVTPAGRLRMISKHGRIALPAAVAALPRIVDAKAYMEQWWDEAAGTFRIQTRVTTPLLGTVFVYAGRFDYRLFDHEAALPLYARPARWERRV